MTAPLSDARLTEIRARLAAATPGPWHVFRDSIVASAWVNRGDDPICEVVTDANDRSPDQGDTDARLIANAPTDLADLLAEVQRLRAVDDGRRTVYSVQHWVDADGIHDGWCTGYGHYTGSKVDAAAQLEYDQRTHPAERFRLASAQITEWREAGDA